MGYAEYGKGLLEARIERGSVKCVGESTWSIQLRFMQFFFVRNFEFGISIGFGVNQARWSRMSFSKRHTVLIPPLFAKTPWCGAFHRTQVNIVRVGAVPAWIMKVEMIKIIREIVISIVSQIGPVSLWWFKSNLFGKIILKVFIHRFSIIWCFLCTFIWCWNKKKSNKKDL